MRTNRARKGLTTVQNTLGRFSSRVSDQIQPIQRLSTNSEVVTYFGTEIDKLRLDLQTAINQINALLSSPDPSTSLFEANARLERLALSLDQFEKQYRKDAENTEKRLQSLERKIKSLQK